MGYYDGKDDSLFNRDLQSLKDGLASTGFEPKQKIKSIRWFFSDFDVSLGLNVQHNVMEKMKGTNPVTKRTSAGVVNMVQVHLNTEKWNENKLHSIKWKW